MCLHACVLEVYVYVCPLYMDGIQLSGELLPVDIVNAPVCLILCVVDYVPLYVHVFVECLPVSNLIQVHNVHVCMYMYVLVMVLLMPSLEY